MFWLRSISCWVQKFLNSRMYSLNKHTQQLLKSQICSLILVVWNIMARKANWKLLVLSLLIKMIKPTQYFILMKYRANVTIKYKNDEGTVTPTILPFTSLIWPMMKKGGPWKLTVAYHKLIQLLTLIAAAISLLMDQVNISSNTWYDLCSYSSCEHLFLHVYFKKIIENNLLQQSSQHISTVSP